MSLISDTIAGLYGGISQQPAAIRHEFQLEDQVNCYSSVVKGLSKRQQSENVGKLINGQLGEANIHTINRDATERYKVILTNGDLNVYDMTSGAEKVVNFPNGKAYLSTTTPRTSFVLMTVNDYTFIVNRDTITALKAEVSTGVISGTVNLFSDLPGKTTAVAVDTIYEVLGDPASNFSSYFVKYTGSSWEETIKPGVATKFDEATLPHKLVREADGTFTFAPTEWTDRTVGDDISNPAPSFIGRRIKDIFFHKNRLAMAAGENNIFSKASNYFTFWRSTATDLLDTDRVDVSVSHSSVSELNFAIPFNKTLLLFADKNQFVLNVDRNLTPSSTAIDQSTAYECSSVARPVGAGSNVFFVTNAGDYSAIREYYVEEGTVAENASNITAHVPELIPKNVSKLTASNNYDLLAVLSEDTPSTVYLYKYYWKGTELAQSSWSKYECTSGTILDVEVTDNFIYLVMQYSDGVYLEYINIQTTALTGTMPIRVLLDRLALVTATYDSVNDITSIPLPYEVDVTDDVTCVLGETFGSSAGAKIDDTYLTRASSTLITLQGDYSGAIYVGIPYISSFRITRPTVKDKSGEPIIGGRLQIRSMTVSFENTAYFKTRVTPKARSEVNSDVVTDLISEFTGRTVGDSYFTLNKPAFTDGSFSFPVLSNADTCAIDIINDSHLQSTFTSMEWSAFFTMNTRRAR